MTAVEALELLRKGNAKVRRSEWDKNDYLYTFGDNDWIYTSCEYECKRGGKCCYPSDAEQLTYKILADFLRDDWEVVE